MILHKMTNKYFKSKSSFYRYTYLEFGKQSLNFFSRDFLKTYIMSNCLKLYGDKSIAVRILLSKILPDLRDKM